MSTFRMQQRRGTTANCASCTDILRDGEIVVEKCPSGTFKMKVGDGTHKFSELPYVACSDTVLTLLEKNKLTNIEAGAQVNLIEAIKVNGTSQTITNKAIDIAVPTKTSDLTNDSGFLTEHQSLSAYRTSAAQDTIDAGKLSSTLKGANNGLAELDANGKVPSSQLPSFVDDVLEYDSSSSFPTTGETGKIYIAQDTNKTYRWSGSAYVVISETLALGTTSSTAYRGDLGNTAYTHSQVTSGNPHCVTKSDVGLGNVENKSSATIRSELTKANVTTALGYTPPTTDTNTTYTLTQDSTDGHKITLTPSSGTATTITIPDNNTTYSDATTSTHGLMSTSDKSKLDGIESGANNYVHPGSGTNPHGTTKSDVGLGNVGNFKAVSTVASQDLTDTEKSNARANIGAGTSSFSGSYNDLTNKPTIPSGAAASKGVDTSISAASTSTNLPTSAAVASFVEGKGYKTTDNNTTYTLTQDSTDGHKITLTPSSGTATTITIPDNNTTYSTATTSANGLMSSTDKSKLDGIASGATANTGTVTSVAVKMNGSTKGTVTGSGTIDLGTVITAHQDISGKADSSEAGYSLAVSGTSVSLKNKAGTVLSTITTQDTNTTYSAATQSAQGLMSAADKTKLDGIASGANAYSLPTASSSTLGGVKVGTNLSISDGVLSATDTTYSTATTSANGLMSSTDKSKLDGIATGANKYTLPVATSSALGGVKSGTDITVDSSGNVSVNDDSHNHIISNIDGLQSALDGKAASSHTHSYIATSAKGAAGGVAELDANGKVPSAQLPSFVDDVIEGYLYNSKFYKESAHTTEIAGETGKIYVDLSTNKTYRWSGSAFVVISETLAIGTTSSTAAAGNHTHSAATTSANGFMSSTDKSKLDGIASGANNYSLPTASSSTLGGVKVGTNLSISNGVLSATDTTYSVATTSANGLMSSTDKSKLDGIASGATANTGTVTSVAVKMNGSTKGTVTTSGTIDLGTVLTSHQDISGKADKASITAGTAGTSSATSGSSLAVPYVTMNAQGIVTGYGTHTHTVTGFLTSHQDISGKANATEAGYSLSVSGTSVSLKNKAGTVLSTITTQDTNTDTKNTAGSTDTSSKIYLVGATSQAANPQTYSDNEIYATSGALTTKTVSVGGGSCTLQYADDAVKFVFA